MKHKYEVSYVVNVEDSLQSKNKIIDAADIVEVMSMLPKNVRLLKMLKDGKELTHSYDVSSKKKQMTSSDAMKALKLLHSYEESCNQ